MAAPGQQHPAHQGRCIALRTQVEPGRAWTVQALSGFGKPIAPQVLLREPQEALLTFQHCHPAFGYMQCLYRTGRLQRQRRPGRGRGAEFYAQLTIRTACRCHGGSVWERMGGDVGRIHTPTVGQRAWQQQRQSGVNRTGTATGLRASVLYGWWCLCTGVCTPS